MVECRGNVKTPGLHRSRNFIVSSAGRTRSGSRAASQRSCSSRSAASPPRSARPRSWCGPLSVLFGFIQSFTYAEIAGLFPNKSGGASVYGAAAWVRYSKFIAPLSVWCNWLAWTPVLAIGCGIAAGYILNALFAPDAAIRTWEIQLARSRLHEGRPQASAQLDLLHRRDPDAASPSPSSIAAFCRTAKVQTIVGVAVLLPLLIIGIVPLITGDVAMQRLPALRARHRSGDGGLEQGRLDAVPRRALHRRLVGLRLRDGDLLHERVPRSGDRHLQGHPLFRPALHRRLHPRAALLPGRARAWRV